MESGRGWGSPTALMAMTSCACVHVGQVALESNRFTAMEAIQRDMRWSEFWAWETASKLAMLSQILNLPKSNLVRQVYEVIVRRGEHSMVEWGQKTESELASTGGGCKGLFFQADSGGGEFSERNRSGLQGSPRRALLQGI